MKKEKIMKAIIFIVILFVPIIYSFFYLKSYWNPYGDLTGMKIAVVNLDKGENEENEGKEFVRSLKEEGTFNICELNQDQANEGMQNGEFYATITVPSNFTQALNSASSKDKQIATITYSPNQATNYLATQIINSAVKTMELNLEEKIDGKIVETLAGKLEEVPDNLENISDGAEEILDGSKDLNSGIQQINEGATTLNNSYTDFDNGVNSALEGSKTLGSGIKQVNSGVEDLNVGATSLDTALSQISAGIDELSSKSNGGITTLTSGVQELQNGANSLNVGINSYVDGTNNLANGATNYIQGTQSLVTNMNSYIDNVNNLNTKMNTLLQTIAAQKNSEDVAMQNLAIQAEQILNTGVISQINTAGTQIKTGGNQLIQNNGQLQQGAKTLLSSGDSIKQGSKNLSKGTQDLLQGASGLTQLTDGITSLKSGVGQVKEGTTNLKNGLTTLNAGTKNLETGSSSLSVGLETLSNNSSKVKSALNTLQDGTSVAENGSTQLVDGVETFNEEIDKGIENTQEQLENLKGEAQFSENPVEFKTEEYGEVNSYGIAFTPLFLSIGLWVGALMGYIVLYYDQKNRFGIFGNNSKNKLLQNALYILIGAVEGIITAALLILGLGYEIQNIGLYYVASALIGITFMSIIQCLIRNFGDVGKFIALIILVLQLAASGGTFPVETIFANDIFN